VTRPLSSFPLPSIHPGYAIIIDEKGEIHERWMEGAGNPGSKDLTPSTITKVSSETKGTTRTVVITR